MNVISPSEDYEEGLRLLRESTGNSTAEYREGQWEAIEHILNKRGPLLVVQKTGWGKSRSEMGASGAVVAAVGPGFGPWGTAGGETRIGISTRHHEGERDRAAERDAKQISAGAQFGRCI